MKPKHRHRLVVKILKLHQTAISSHNDSFSLMWEKLEQLEKAEKAHHIRITHLEAKEGPK